MNLGPKGVSNPAFGVRNRFQTGAGSVEALWTMGVWSPSASKETPFLQKLVSGGICIGLLPKHWNFPVDSVKDTKGFPFIKNA